MLLLFLGFYLALPARANSIVDHIMAAPEAPPGVVFEIITGDDDGLSNILPEIEEQITKLRSQYPQLDIAIVSHGAEQFGLLAGGRSSLPELHERVVSLQGASVPVHVCGIHASWRDKTPEDFPPYVDVAASGPAQVRSYRDLGYLVIEIP